MYEFGLQKSFRSIETYIYIYIHIKNSEILKNFDQYVLRLTTSECTAKLEYKEASANKHEASDGK